MKIKANLISGRTADQGAHLEANYGRKTPGNEGPDEEVPGRLNSRSS